MLVTGRLSLDDPTVEVVRPIFGDYLDGFGDRAIVNGLDRDGVPCPDVADHKLASHARTRRGDIVIHQVA